MLVLGCFKLGEAFKTLFGDNCVNLFRNIFWVRSYSHTATPKVAKAAAKVAKRATAALVSIMVLLIFLSILHIASKHIRLGVKNTYKDRGALYSRL